MGQNLITSGTAAMAGAGQHPLHQADRLNRAGLSNIAHIEALRRLESLAKSCPACGERQGGERSNLSGAEAEPVPIGPGKSTLRHYPVSVSGGASQRSERAVPTALGLAGESRRPVGEGQPASPTALQTEAVLSGSISPTVGPSSPSTSFLSSLFGRGPGPSPAQSPDNVRPSWTSLSVPPLWTHLPDQDYD